MKSTFLTTRLNWIVTLTALALAIVVAASPAF
jgi:hypothetical protein